MKENQKDINKAPTQPKKVELITLTGITTSQINQALKADNSYPARVFLKIDRSEKKLVGHYDPTKRQCYMCLAELTNQENIWCQSCKEKRLNEDIPVFFRIKEKNYQVKPCQECNYPKKGSWEKQVNCQTKEIQHQVEEVWIRPKIKTNSLIEVQGYFSIGTVYTKNSERKSFTATSYTLLSCPHSQKKTCYCPIGCPCLKGQNLKGVLNQEIEVNYARK